MSIPQIKGFPSIRAAVDFSNFGNVFKLEQTFSSLYKSIISVSPAYPSLDTPIATSSFNS